MYHSQNTLRSVFFFDLCIFILCVMKVAAHQPRITHDGNLRRTPVVSTRYPSAAPTMRPRSMSDATVPYLVSSNISNPSSSSHRVAMAPTISWSASLPPGSAPTNVKLMTCDAFHTYNVTSGVPLIAVATWLCFTDFKSTVTVGTIHEMINTRLNVTFYSTEYGLGQTALIRNFTTTATMFDVPIAYPTEYTSWPSSYEWTGTLPCLVNNQTDSCYTTVGGITPMTVTAPHFKPNRTFPQLGDAIGSNCYLHNVPGLYYSKVPSICNIAPFPNIRLADSAVLGAEALLPAAFLVVTSTSYSDDGPTTFAMGPISAVPTASGLSDTVDSASETKPVLQPSAIAQTLPNDLPEDSTAIISSGNSVSEQSRIPTISTTQPEVTTAPDGSYLPEATNYIPEPSRSSSADSLGAYIWLALGGYLNSLDYTVTPIMASTSALPLPMSPTAASRPLPDNPVTIINSMDTTISQSLITTQGTLVLDGSTLTSDAPSVVLGTQTSHSGSKIIAAGTTAILTTEVPVVQGQSSLTSGPELSPGSEDALGSDSKTAPITSQGILASQGILVLGGSTLTFLPEPTSGPPGVVLGTQTLHSGSKLTLSGMTVTLISGMPVVQGTSSLTSRLGLGPGSGDALGSGTRTSPATTQGILVVGGSTLTFLPETTSGVSGVVLGTQTLHSGSEITLAGKTVTLSSGIPVVEEHQVYHQDRGRVLEVRLCWSQVRGPQSRILVLLAV